MPHSVPVMAVEKILRVVPPSQGPLSHCTIQSQRKTNGYKTFGEKINRNNSKPKTYKAVCPPSPPPPPPPPIPKPPNSNTTTGPRIVAGPNGLNVDERLRLARERRQEYEKLLASRELRRLEREQRARRYHEQQLNERKKKLLGQRLKEETRRAAVEHKRRQKLQEEKERHASAVRKTLERSQRIQQNLVQNSRGRRRSTGGVPRRSPLTAWEKNLVSRLLTPTCSYLARSRSAGCQSAQEVSCHSMNITTTTAAKSITPTRPTSTTPIRTISTPTRPTSTTPTRPIATPTRPTGTPTRPIATATRPIAISNRPIAPPTRPIATPTKPIATPNRPIATPTRPSTTTIRVTTTTTTTTRATTLHKPQHPPGPAHNRTSASPIPSNSKLRRVNVAQVKAEKQQRNLEKKISNSKSSTRPPAAGAGAKPAWTREPNQPPPQNGTPSPSPSPQRSPRRSGRKLSSPLQLELPSVPEEDILECVPVVCLGSSPPAETLWEGLLTDTRDEGPPEAPCSDPVESRTEAASGTEPERSSPQRPPAVAPRPPEVTRRPVAGTSDPEEASRLLAERRRQARLQREREERECLQREEDERRSREELERRRAAESARLQAEESARLQAEAQRLVEEKRRRDEEEQRRAEEERAQAAREAALLQRQREEEQARERENIEQLKRERELLAQREDAARQARKKRLEEIMRRTRRTDCADTKPAPAKILASDAQPKENTEPPKNGSTEAETKPSQLGLNGIEDMVPVVAFKERRSIRNLTGLEEIQTHQRAEVI